MKKRNIITALVILLGILGISFLIYRVWKNNFNIDALTIWLENHGIMARFVYAALVALQVVVAVIPAGPLEVAGGYAFGTLQSTIFYLIGAFIGSLFVFLMVRKFGKPLAELFISQESLNKFEPMTRSKKGRNIFAIIFMIPGSPKDVLCYVAGFSSMKLSTFLLISSIGRLPALIGTSLTASCAGKSQYGIAIVAAVVTLLVCAIGGIVYKKLLEKHNNNKVETQMN